MLTIEQSKLQLYTKRGDPSSALTHAEQQVLDWLEWVERNSAYARQSMPGLVRPVGFVIIGRRTQLNDKFAQKLERRNQNFNGAIQILTYDDLLEKSKNTLDMLMARRDAIEEAP
jgi:Domain of unknown function (DUF4263)